MLAEGEHLMLDETLDVFSFDEDTKELLPSPLFNYNPKSLPPGPPNLENNAGELNFTVSINSENTHGNKYLYSLPCNRIYVHISKQFALEFNWNFEEAKNYGSMFVRATLLFSDNSYSQQRVLRCVQHLHGSQEVEPQIVDHVLRSDRPYGTEGVFYTGSKDVENIWLSVLVMFNSTDNIQSFNHAFRLECKNSCSTGINRRNTEIMFTLEDEFGTILGCQKIGVRVCSCPRRDMNRDEECLPVTKRPAGSSINHKPPPTKRVAKSNDEEANINNFKICTVPSGLQVLGVDVLNAGLRVMADMLNAKKDNGEPAVAQVCKEQIAKINSYLQGNQCQTS